MEDIVQNVEHGEEPKKIRFIVKLVSVVAVLAVGMLGFQYFASNPVEAERKEMAEERLHVDVQTLQQQDWAVRMEAHGKVEAVTRTTLVSEVAGAVEFVSPKLKKGGQFAEGEVILRVSQADFVVQLEQNKAAVAEAELVIAQEEARAQQAIRDWKRLGRGGEPSLLVRRQPQLKSAHARLRAAKALVVKAQRDLEKTEIKAPYGCVVSMAAVDQGGYLRPAGVVAEVYALGKVQVVLPLRLADMAYLSESLVGAKVDLLTEVGREIKYWNGRVVRSEGEVDRSTHTMKVVVEVTASDTVELPPIGLFVKGFCEGRKIENALRIPRVAVRDGSSVCWVNGEDKLQIAKVEIERREHDHVIVVGGLPERCRVVVSPIEFPIQGTLVVAKESEPKK